MSLQRFRHDRGSTISGYALGNAEHELLPLSAGKATQNVLRSPRIRPKKLFARLASRSRDAWLCLLLAIA